MILTTRISVQLKTFSILFLLASFFTSCITSRKMDKFVAKQYNNTIPKQDKKELPEINVSAAMDISSNLISTTETKTSNMLPLLFYWQWEYKNTCTLNPAIGVNQFTKILYSQSGKRLVKKLNAQKLDIKIEQMPNVFAFDDKAHLIWIIYAFGWDQVSVQPDKKDMIVSYNVLKEGQIVKQGKIILENPEQNKGLRFFQSWKSAVSEYISLYNSDINIMAKSFASKLEQELGTDQ